MNILVVISGLLYLVSSGSRKYSIRNVSVMVIVKLLCWCMSLWYVVGCVGGMWVVGVIVMRVFLGKKEEVDRWLKFCVFGGEIVWIFLD